MSLPRIGNSCQGCVFLNLWQLKSAHVEKASPWRFLTSELEIDLKGLKKRAENTIRIGFSGLQQPVLASNTQSLDIVEQQRVCFERSVLEAFSFCKSLIRKQVFWESGVTLLILNLSSCLELWHCLFPKEI